MWRHLEPPSLPTLCLRRLWTIPMNDFQWSNTLSLRIQFYTLHWICCYVSWLIRQFWNYHFWIFCKRFDPLCIGKILNLRFILLVINIHATLMEKFMLLWWKIYATLTEKLFMTSKFMLLWWKKNLWLVINCFSVRVALIFPSE